MMLVMVLGLFMVSGAMALDPRTDNYPDFTPLPQICYTNPVGKQRPCQTTQTPAPSPSPQSSGPKGYRFYQKLKAYFFDHRFTAF
jgi:hypothetical protein